MDIDKIKSDIIQSLLYNYVWELCKNFNSDMLVINDCDLVNDNEMYIFIDTELKEDDFNNYDMYKLYLSDFQSECERFIDVIDREIPQQHLIYSKFYHEIYEKGLNGETIYECCQLHFRIKELDIY